MVEEVVVDVWSESIDEMRMSWVMMMSKVVWWSIVVEVEEKT